MLRLAVIADRLPRSPWTVGPMVLAACRDLALRGHEVTLIADSVEHAPLAGAARVITRTVYDHRARASIKGVAALAASWLHQIKPDVSISFSRVACADVWLPLEPSARSRHGHVTRRLGPGGPLCVGAVIHDLKHAPSDALDTLAERKHGVPGPGVRYILTLGPAAALVARRELPAVRDRVAPLPLPALIPRVPQAMAAVLRKRVRTLLKIAPERVVALCSATGGIDRHLLPLFDAVAHLHAGHRGQGPLLLVVASDAVAVQRAADAGAPGGLSGAVRVVTPTHRFEALLAAADLVVAPIPRHGSAWSACGPARLAADAMLHSRPILALRGAPGAEYIRPDAPTPGLVVRQPRPLDWYVALQTAMDPTWRVGCGVAARAVADVQGFAWPRWLDEVEAVLADVSAQRTAGSHAVTRVTPSPGASSPAEADRGAAAPRHPGLKSGVR